jgi:hypothetical protein
MHFLFEMHLNIFKNIKKYKNIFIVHLNILQAHKVVSAETDMFCTLFVFLQSAQKISILCETSRAHTEDASLHAIFFYFF